MSRVVQRESSIERAVCLYARKTYGMLTPKLVSPSNNGYPDRMIISTHGVVAFVEFKSARGKLTELQTRQLNALREHNCDVFVVRDVEKGKQLVDLIADPNRYTKLIYGRTLTPAQPLDRGPELILPPSVSGQSR